VRYFLGALFLVIIALFETSVLPFFPIFGTQTSLLLIVLLALSLLGFLSESYYGAFFGGILLDLLGGTPLGFSSLILVLLMGGVSLIRRFAEGSFLVLLLMTFLTSVIFRVVFSLPTFHPSSLLKGGFLDVGMMIVLYPTLRYLFKNVFGRKELKVGI